MLFKKSLYFGEYLLILLTKLCKKFCTLRMGNKCVNYVLVIYIYVVTKIFYNKSKVVNIEALFNVIKKKSNLSMFVNN